MSDDIWSGIGKDITPDEGEWLYKVGTEMRGPMPHRQVVDKLMKGDIEFSTPVAREGTDFHPLRSVAAFLPHLEAAQRARVKREAATKRKKVFMALVPVIALAAGALFYIQTLHKAQLAKEAKVRAALEAKLAAQQQQQQSALNVPKMGLVALVSLGTEQDVKITGQRPAGEGAPRTKHKKHEKASAGPDGSEEAAGGGGGGDEDIVQTCALTQQDIFGTLRNSLSKLTVCVDDEKKRDAEGLLPPVLSLQFIVKPNGKVTEFAIDDRHYRTGPLNNCLVKAFSAIVFPESNGANCPVTIPIKISK